MKVLWIALAFACAEEPSNQLDAASEKDASADAGDPSDAGFADASAEDATPTDAGFPTEVVLGEPRPARMLIPADHDGSTLDLVVLLHGYGVDGATQDAYFGLSTRVDTRRFFLILPDGTREASAQMSRFWNATDACCDFYMSGVDDVSYLTDLIAEAKSRFSVGRVYLIGHSNGGYMSYRLACDAADQIDALISLAGATFLDEGRCNASRPVSVLQIHGTADDTVLYNGLANYYPGAEETVLRWATRAGCETAQTDPGAPFDLDTALPGDETEVETYRAGCAPGIEVELWRIQNGTHIPSLALDYGDRILDWVFAH